MFLMFGLVSIFAWDFVGFCFLGSHAGFRVRLPYYLWRMLNPSLAHRVFGRWIRRKCLRRYPLVGFRWSRFWEVGSGPFGIQIKSGMLGLWGAIAVLWDASFGFEFHLAEDFLHSSDCEF